MRRALLAVVCFTACSPTLESGSAVILCASDADCPEGLTCVDGRRCLRDEAIDQEGSRQIAPEEDARVWANTAIAFVWTPVTGASRYWLTIATDPGFSQLVADSPRELTAPTDEVVLPEGTYWWRAVSDVSADANRVAPRRLAVRDKALYVYCAADDSCEERADIAELGTIAFPFRSIQRAIDARSGAEQIRVARRAPGYRESVKIVGGGFELVGGFSNDFTTRGEHTSITADGPVFDAVDILDATTVTGFNFIRSSGTSPVTTITLGSRLLVFDNCTWNDAAEGRYLVVITSSSGTIIRNSVLTRSDGVGPAVAALNGGMLQLEDVTISVSGTDTGAVQIANASQLEARRITVDVNDSASTTTFGILVSQQSRVSLTDSTLDVKGYAVQGVTLAGVDMGTIDRCRIAVDGAQAFGVTLLDDTQAWVRDNVVTVRGNQTVAGSAIAALASTKISYLQGNTLIDLAPPVSEHRSIALDGANAVIVNNLLIASPDCAGSTLRCVGLYDGGSATALHSNAFVGFSGTNGFVYANGSVSAKLPSDVPTSVRDSGNLSYDSRALAGLPDVEIRPLPTSDLIAKGHDPNASDCGSSADGCGRSLTDLDGTARPNPPTIGALEP